MKIRCKECNTVYDSSEKYCPYCFTKTRRNASSVEHSFDQRKKTGNEKKQSTAKTVTSPFHWIKKVIAGLGFIGFINVIFFIVELLLNIFFG